MIVRPRPGPLAILFTLKGSILPQVAPKVLAITLVACAIVAAELRWPDVFPREVGIGPFTLIGLAISIFLSFRNGACYDRWWEARKAWGSLIVESRGIARLLCALLPDDAGLGSGRRICLRRLSAFAHALHAVLRGGAPAAAAAPWLDEAEARALAGRSNVPDAILARIDADLAQTMREGVLSDVVFATIERKVAALSQIQAVCERIRFTPLPFAYTLLLYRTAWLYCLLLPFGLVSSLGWATPLAAALVAYTFFGLDALGDELEEPFGTDPNDLPLDALLSIVDAGVLDALGENPQPAAPLQDGFVLR